MQLEKPLKLGTRGSPLALIQAQEVKSKLCAAHQWPGESIEIVVMKTTGDQFVDRPLSAIGGKGLFTKELEDGLYAGTIDFAVHSTKDVATILPEGLVLCCVLPREDVRDAFVSKRFSSIKDLPLGAVVGTSSLRRKSQLLHIRPDLEVIEFRGSVGTRMEKLEAGQAEATFLAVAGLNRLGNRETHQDYAHPIEVSEMLPAVAQGAISIEIREVDAHIKALLAPLHDDATAFAVRAERAMLRKLDGSCRTPIAGYYDGNVLRAEVLSLDGTKVLRAQCEGEEAESLGILVGEKLLEQGAAEIF